MKLFWVLFVHLSALVASQQDATKEEQLARALQLLQTMPQCARVCLAQAVAASGVSLGNLDLTASCTNATNTAIVEGCVRETCLPREQLTAKNVTETLCQRPVREVSDIPIGTYIGAALATTAFFMRMLSKVTFPCERGARIDNDLWWDDAVITFAWILMIPISVLSGYLAKLGMGRDVWTIHPDNITQLLKVYYFDEMMYVVALPVIKISMLLTYLRIFQSKRFRWLVFGALGLNIAYLITFLLITMIQCRPLSLAWLRWTKEYPGTCNNINAQSWAAAALNIVLDVIVVGLPIPMLWRMDLNIRKKLLVMLMFGVGFFVTIVSILRLRLLVRFGDSENLTHDYKQAGFWTIVELHTAIVCACMPGIRNLLRRAWPKLMGQTVASTGASTAPSTGLSGRTAVSSGVDKSGTQVFTRPRHSDDGDFIPLEERHSQRDLKAVSPA
ncbi:hypothetical protein CB0940_03827 [Cercospora beticola]|uniref:Uncharacterized protein n=1 Tax=Cercospora beticola TaxID=122368 RepID=A0A2G5I5H4_CERBT|nr:hypothetical protein CB0940_03827 [Cercospora beticola]PIB00022.1 hypothetical protein CB0940_03827 [Cercospora beticola]WPB01024.1 hypothetical protein RHO25_005644 [Cercospora beticola]CAK1360710.1 unnamed protein product [Cercospora beticola]